MVSMAFSGFTKLGIPYLRSFVSFIFSELLYVALPCLSSLVWAHFSGFTKLDFPYSFILVSFRFSGLLNPAIP